MKHTQIVHPEMPGRTFVLRLEYPRAVFEVLDLTRLDEKDLMRWKEQTVNYSTTEAGGRYFGLVLADMADADQDAPDFGHFLSRIFLEAADWWNTRAITTMN